MENGESTVQPHRRRSWIRWLFISLGVILLVLVVFHGPILRAVIQTVAQRVAASQNLSLQFRLEGDPLDQIDLHNVHATATGPSALQSLEAGQIKVDYSIPDLLLHGMSDALKNVELHNVTAVLDSSKAPLPTPTPPPQPNEKVSLPAFFPDRLVLSDVNLTMKGQPQDTVVKDLNLGLYPDREGQISVAKLQIPNVHTWTDIHGTTSYAGKNLYLRNLTLDEHHQLRTVNLDASKIGQGKLGLQFEGNLGGGDLNSRVELSTRGNSYGTKTNLHAKDISLGQLAEYLGRTPGQMSGEVKNVDIDWQGTLDAPQSWQGTIKAQISNLHESGLALDHVGLDVEAQNGQAVVHDARVDQGVNHLQVRGSIDLPKTTRDFGRTPGSFQISINAPDLKQLTAFLSPPATGSLVADGTLKTGQDQIALDLHAQGDLLGFQGAAVKQLVATINATKKLPPIAPRKKEAPDASSFYDGLSSKIQAQLTEVRYGDYAVDQIQAQVTSDGVKVSLAPLTATRKNDTLRLTGNFQLPQPNEQLLKQPADLQFTLRAPQLSDYWKSDAPGKVTGELQADGSVRLRDGIASGLVNLSGAEITAQKLVVKQISLQATIADNVVYLNDLTAAMNAQDYLQAHGTFDLRKPYKYTGAVSANLTDLSTFAPLLATADQKTPLAGSLVVNWKGDGEAATFKNNGNLDLKLERGRYADLQHLQANVQAHYTPEELQVPIVYLGSDAFSFQAILRAQGSTLEIDKIEIDQGTAKYANGSASLPFVWSNLGTSRKIFPANGKVALNFQSENLDIAKLFKDLGKPPPASGQLSVKLSAAGPLDRLNGSLDLQLQSLRADAVKQLEPATINLAARLQDNQLRLDGKVQQPRIQPVQLSANLPFNLSKIIAARKLDDSTPVRAQVQMPRSSVNFVRQFVPALSQLDGTVALNVNVNGTIARPDLSGSADMNINVARFENSTLPALTNFKALLNFRRNRLTFDRFGGDLAGGPFTLAGSIDLLKLTDPRFDLRFKANSILVARNDDVTARVDADVKVQGPLNSASVSGEVLTTNSRFLKNIEIIPISLPGRPAPLPEPPSSSPSLSFPNPPLRDWKFNVAIKSKDPFLIRGNLATGKAIIDMKLAGTGLHPQILGQVRLENFDATLPFSTLTINRGFLYFNPDDPLNPRIDLQGESLIQDYTVKVYVYGTADAPQAIFSSEPPLPQEDIISLLATGVTREQLTGSGNVLASRALILLGKELYRKVFHKTGETQESNSVFSRLDVQFGEIDPRTGEQTATAKYKINQHFQLIGDIGVQGDFRGLVKYLIRFR